MFLRLNNLIKFTRVSRPICQSAVRLNEDTSKDISGSVATKFQVFRNETGIVFDIEEERKRFDENDEDEMGVFPSVFAGINLEREFANLSLFLVILKWFCYNLHCRWCKRSV